ncbi:MAG: hypothetical protein A2V84_01185 [Chloroflexi bacterium RBG_16_70_13]|nr:MAG: hypothetical protein A2V84_01185 [Chloroflexi bacterium RBG_16_70_13]
MSLDRRLRGALGRAAQTVEPDTDERLRIVLDRGRARREQPLGLALIGAATIVVLLIGTRYLPGIQGPGVVPAASPDPRAAVAGTYAVTLQPSDPGVTGLGLAGIWSITLQPSGAIDLEPPATFEGSAATGHTFAIEGDSFRTDLYYNDYCDSVATYGFVSTSSSLTFTARGDTCEIRLALLATRPWVRER